MTGATYESILEAFIEFGEIEDINLVPGKSFSFVTFVDTDSAERAYEESNGKKSLTQSKNPIFMTYVNSIPDNFKLSFTHQKTSLPEGLEVITDFVTEEEESKLLQSISWDKSDANLKHRQVRHFGKEFVYGTNTISNDSNVDPFPPSWQEMLQKSIKLGYQTRFPDQCTVNRYLPGHGIPPHVDNHLCCDDTIVSLSLLSDVIMNFVSLDDKDKKSIPVNLPRRSLMVMSGRTRYAFTHGITPHKNDVIQIQSETKPYLTLRKRQERISFTFRKSIDRICECPFIQHCPSRAKDIEEMDDATASQLEKMHVHKVYEEIADHFSETRHKPWPNVSDFLNKKLNVGDVLVDVGCGNGKYLGLVDNIFQIGLDYSQNLLKIVQRRGSEAVRTDALNLPIKDQTADVCISIAVIHHFSTKERRIRAIQEIFRILKVNGSALIYAWAKEQDFNKKASTYLLQQNNDNESTNLDEVSIEDLNVRLPVHENRTKFQHKDLLVPWKNKTDTSTLHRFYHVFEEGELESLVKEALPANAMFIESLYHDQGNWCISFVKK